MDMESEIYCNILSTLKRAVWRMQYYSKKRIKREVPLVEEKLNQAKSSFENDLVGNIHIEEMMRLVPHPQSRHILKMIYIECKTEKEIARDLHITQQAVSKWKRKAIAMLRSRISS